MRPWYVNFVNILYRYILLTDAVPRPIFFVLFLQSHCFSTGCNSSTASPALIYFPAGTYLVSAPIIAYFDSQLIGDYNQRPTLLASANFTGIAVIDADPYRSGGANWYINQNKSVTLQSSAEFILTSDCIDM